MHIFYTRRMNIAHIENCENAKKLTENMKQYEKNVNA